MAVALRALAVREEALRHHQMQIVLGPGHRDIEQAALFFDLRAEVPAPRSDGMQPSTTLSTIDRFPFLALGGMDGREDQIVLVEQRHAGLVAGRVGRIERQFGEEALARRIAAGDLFELDQVGAAGLGIFVDAVEVRLVPQPRAFDVGRPLGTADVRDGADEVGPVVAGAGRRRRQPRAPRSDRRRPPCGRAPSAPRRGRPPGSGASTGSRRRGRADSRRTATAPACP